MENTEELILCRLCLSIISDNDFETLKDNDRKMFEMVVPEIQLEQNKEHQICCKCSKTLLKSYEFKWTYLKGNKRKILPKYSTSLKNMGANLNENIYETIVKKEEPFGLCSFCRENIEDVNEEVNQNEEDFYIKMILEKCFSELDFSNSSNVKSCSSCLDLLEKQFAFVCSCLHTDQKIKNYYSFHGEYDQKKVHLHEIVNFNLKKENERFYSRNQTEMIWLDETSPFSKSEEPIYKQEYVEKSESSKDTLKMEEIEIKTEEKLLNKNLENDITQDENAKKPDKTEMFYCQNCSYQTRFRHNIIRHCFTYKESPETTTYKCELCTFESKFKCALREHRLNHKNSSELSLYKCELCTYETTRKGHLSSHMLVHKPRSEVMMYKCETCPYESRHKGALKVHILTHKDSSNTVMYKCDMCTYETKRKGDLKIHSASRHKDLQNAPIKEEMLPRKTEAMQASNEYENSIEETNKKLSYCFTCQKGFSAKGELKIHMFTKHKQSVNIKMHECKLCVYVTPRSSDLKRHLLLHTDNLPYECILCQKCFSQKNNLKRHLVLKHKETKNVKIHKCKLCEYKTPEKGNFNRHLRVHNNDMSYQCEVCQKKFNEKHKLNMHIFSKHKNNVELAEIRVYQCKSCNYKTPRKNDLNKHLQLHSSNSSYKCDICQKEFKLKQYLNSHLKSHR